MFMLLHLALLCDQYNYGMAMVGRTFIRNLYGELNIRSPDRIVPGFTVIVDFLIPPSGSQNGRE